MICLEFQQKCKVQCNFLEFYGMHKAIKSIIPDFQLPDKTNAVEYRTIPTSQKSVN